MEVKKMTNNAYEEPKPENVLFKGITGKRINNLINNRLKQIINNPLVMDGFRHKDLPYPWRKDFKDETWEGTVSYSWLGEHIGKWLHASTILSICTNDSELMKLVREKADQLISFQDEDGYLGMYDKESRMTAKYGEHSKGSWDIWVHRYNIYGLLVVYQYTGETKYLSACEKMCDLLYETFGPEGRNIAYEGTRDGISALTVLESIMMLYSHTGKNKYLEFARHIIYDSSEKKTKVLSRLLSAGEANKVGRGKAYQVMAVMLGFLQYYRYTGDTKVLEAVSNCWEDIKYRHLHITGGPWSTETSFNTNKECFADASFWKPTSLVETCSATTWVQLNCLLLEITGHVKYAEEVEKTFLNHHLGAHSSDCGASAYFSSPNDVNRNYGSSLNCCGSSLPRVYAMIATHAFMRTEKGIAVNLYMDNEYMHPLDNAKKLHVTQTVTINSDNYYVDLEIESDSDEIIPFELRIPSWTKLPQISIDSERNKDTILGGSKITIERSWFGKHLIKLIFPMTLDAVIKSYQLSRIAAFRYGPYVLSCSGVLGLENNNMVYIDAEITDEVDGKVHMERVDCSNETGIAFKAALKITSKKQSCDMILLEPYYIASEKHKNVTTWFVI